MKACYWVAAAVGLLWSGATLFAVEPTRPIPLIFDTDIGNDVDDALALGVIHALQSRAECRLLAVTITKDHELAAPFVDAVNTFYGRGDIPIGVCRSGVTNEVGKFLGLANERDQGQLRYPHDLLSGTEAPPAVDVLRATLAGADDASVVIAQVGFSTNLADLLKSKPDGHSPLAGIDLVRRKVRLLSIMAGAFTQIIGDQGQPYDHREYNIVMDVASAQKLAAEWPTPIVWSGFEIGLALAYPHQSIERDFAYVTHHPLAEAYVRYSPPPHDRPTWDLTSVLYAIRPDRAYFGVSQPGRVTVADNGLTTFVEAAEGRDRILVINEDKRRTLESLQLLSSQPPLKVRDSGVAQ